MDEQLAAGRARSILAWGKRAHIKSSTIHAAYNSGTTSPENVVKLARAVGITPKDAFIRIGWFDEELGPDDPNLKLVMDALARLPQDLRPLGAALAADSIARLQGHLGQSISEIYLQGEDRQE